MRVRGHITRLLIWRWALAPAAAALLLGGCAAALVPVVAGGALANKEFGGPGKPDSAPHPERLPIDLSASVQPALAAKDKAALAKPAAIAPAAARIELPASPATPPFAAQDDAWAAFVQYALVQALPPAPGIPRQSALVDQDSLTATPRLTPCNDVPLAVLLDLDPGEASFDPADPPLPAAGLAERLAELRRGGVTVLWAASLPVDRAKDVYTVLRASGLDPDRTDRLVLTRRASERKQTRRIAAGRDWCIIAIAGDRRADFDEVFDYLRDPDGPIARALAPTFGHGWFLVPTPID